MARIELVKIEMSSKPIYSDYEKYCQSHSQDTGEEERG